MNLIRRTRSQTPKYQTALGMEPYQQQSVTIGNPNGSRLHLIRGRMLKRNRWHYTTILTIGRRSLEYRKSSF